MLNQNSDVVVASLNKLPPKEKLEQSRAILLVSVGMENDGPNFLATLDMLSSAGFKNVTILVADTLQRYTVYGLNLSRSMEEAKKISLSAGDRWIAKNSSLIEKYGFDILRWEELLGDPNYQTNRVEIENIYRSNQKIKDAIDNTAKSFSERYNDLKGKLFYEESALIDCSRNYLIEECPFIPMWYNKKIDYIIYPNSPNQAIQAVRDYYIKDKRYIDWLRFDFSYRKIKEIKLNAIQNQRHGFSVSRNFLMLSIKNYNLESYLYNIMPDIINDDKISCKINYEKFIIDDLLNIINDKTNGLTVEKKTKLINKLTSEILLSHEQENFY